MIKNLVILMSLCLVVKFCSATETINTIIKNVNDREINQPICNPAIQNGDIQIILTKMQKCLRNKRQEKLFNRQTKRSTEGQINLEKLMQTLKQLSESSQKNNTDNKLNIFVGVAQINADSTTLKCDAGKNLKIINARLTSLHYEDKCESTLNDMDKMTKEMIGDLNEPCDENTNTMINTVKMCDNKNECKINVDTAFSGICDCTHNKYVEITFTCVDMKAKSRSKRALHYRNKPIEAEQERNFRQMLARAQGLDILLNGYNYPIYGDYYYGLPLYGGAYPFYGPAYPIY